MKVAIFRSYLVFLLCVLGCQAEMKELELSVSCVFRGIEDDAVWVEFEVKNDTEDSLVFERAELPWITKKSLIIILMKPEGLDDRVISQIHGIEDVFPESIILAEGKALKGRVNLLNYYPTLLSELEETNLIMFWSYQMHLDDGAKSSRAGGHLIIERAP